MSWNIILRTIYIWGDVRLFMKYYLRDNFHTLTKDHDWLKHQTNVSFGLMSSKTPMNESIHEILRSVNIKIKSIKTLLPLRLITSKTTAELLQAMHCLFKIWLTDLSWFIYLNLFVVSSLLYSLFFGVIQNEWGSQRDTAPRTVGNDSNIKFSFVEQRLHRVPS